MTAPNRQDERDHRIAACLEDYRRRQSLGEDVQPDAYREELGEGFRDFLDILEAETLFEVGLQESVERLPRTFGPYTLLSEIGRGTGGVVYAAVHRDLGRGVAIKVLRTGLDTDPEARLRFQREAATCSRLRNDHVVPIYDFGYVDRVPYYAMPKIVGTSLRDLRSPKGAEEVAVWCTRFADLLAGLRELHAVGVVHRDIKPSNILLDEHDRLVLVDFGLARDVNAVSVTQTGDVLGTPMYMSPEQIMCRFDEVDARTDIYCLGTTMYEVFVGAPRFAAAPIYDLMQAVTARRPKEPRQRNPAIPAALNRVILKCIEPRREDRYPSVQALESDLRAIATGNPVASRPVGRLQRLARRVRPNRKSVGVMALAAAVGVAFWSVRASRPAELVLKSFEGVEVSIDGGDFRPVAPVLRVPAGRRRLAFRREGHVPLTKHLTLDPGDRVTGTILLPPVSPEDGAAVRRLIQLLGAEPMQFQQLPGALRMSHAPPVTLYWPRGSVRSDGDLLTMAWHTSDAFDEDAELRVLRGRDVLHRAAFDPRGGFEVVPLPASVRQAVSARDQLTWGVYAGDKAVAAAQMRVVASAPADAALQRLATALSWSELTPDQALRLRMLVLAAYDLHTAVVSAAEHHRLTGAPLSALLATIEGQALFRMFHRERRALLASPL